MSPIISVIVPVLNEENLLPILLSQAADWPVAEVVIVDGGSNDQSQLTLGLWSSENNRKNRFLVAPKGRGVQMNAGAEAATGDLLFFLHADSTPPPAGFEAIAKALQDPHVVGGAFRLAIDSPSLFLKGVSHLANLRSTLLGLPYGDQGIFVRSTVFKKMGGYKHLPLMEDVEFIQRLKQEGKIRLLNQVIKTSPRRWAPHGGGANRPLPLVAGWKGHQRKYIVSLRNLVLLVLYFLGVCPAQLARWYNDGHGNRYKT